MDPKSSYLLEIKLVGNPRCRKEVSCFIISMVVDSDTCNFKDLVDEIVEKYPPGYEELVTVAYYDAASRNHLEVKTHQELLAMFAKHVDSKVVHMAIAYTLPSEIPEWPNAEPSSSMHETSHPTNVDASSDDDTTPDDDPYLTNPEPENEFVGVDEEGLYLTNAPKIGASHEGMTSKSDSEFDSDEDYEEEDGLVGKDPIPPSIVAYDKEDPLMDVGSTYMNMSEFKLALSYYAIKHEFEFNIEKSDPGRYRVYCSRKVQDGCRWRLHASTMDDKVSIKVAL